jgi:hypothetical protein
MCICCAFLTTEPQCQVSAFIIFALLDEARKVEALDWRGGGSTYDFARL